MADDKTALTGEAVLEEGLEDWRWVLDKLVARFDTGSFNVELFLSNAFDTRADITRFTQCDEQICRKPYVVTNQPRTFGIKFGQRF